MTKLKMEKTNLKHYDKLTDKNQDIDKLNVKMKTNSKYFESFVINGENSARTAIIYNIKNIETQTSEVAIFTNVRNAICSRLLEDVARLAKLKKSFKVTPCVNI